MTSAMARPDEVGISLPVFRQRLAEEESAGGIAVFFRRDDPVERGFDDQAVDDPLGALDRELRLVALLDDNGERRLVGGGARLHIHFELRQPLAGFGQREDVLLRFDGADQIVGHRVELAATDVVARREQGDGIFRRLDGAVGLRLGHLLLRFVHLGLGLLEREHLVGRIDLEHHFAGLHRRAGREQRDQPQRAARGWHHERRGPARADLAVGVHRELQRRFHNARRGQTVAAAVRQRRHGEQERRCGRRDHQPDDADDQQPAFHRGLRI